MAVTLFFQGLNWCGGNEFHFIRYSQCLKSQAFLNWPSEYVQFVIKIQSLDICEIISRGKKVGMQPDNTLKMPCGSHSSYYMLDRVIHAPQFKTKENLQPNIVLTDLATRMASDVKAGWQRFECSTKVVDQPHIFGLESGPFPMQGGPISIVLGENQMVHTPIQMYPQGTSLPPSATSPMLPG